MQTTTTDKQKRFKALEEGTSALASSVNAMGETGAPLAKLSKDTQATGTKFFGDVMKKSLEDANALAETKPVDPAKKGLVTALGMMRRKPGAFLGVQ